MKTKIVLWAERNEDEKILLGIELLASENLIRIHVIPEKDATEIFYNQMMNQWREGQTIPMPETETIIDRPLSMTEGLLPDDIKTDRQDIIARAKTEWHFVVLSSKLYEAYADELAQIKERIDELTDFDGAIWEEMRAFWDKVQEQVREKNLFREHASELRTKTNSLFDTLKSLKKAMNDEFERVSKEYADDFFQKLQNIEERIEKGLGLQPIFNELKNLQSAFKDASLTRKHHNDVWKRLDGAFKKVKEKKYGKPAEGTSSALLRLNRRYEGLLSAITKMEQSIKRDIKDKEFQQKRINSTDGQLELQIRQAKMAIIEERITSKQTKLDDMLKTKAELEKKIADEQVKSDQRKAQKEHKKQVKKAVADAKAEIAKEIEEKNETIKDDPQIQKAAAAIIEATADQAEKNSKEAESVSNNEVKDTVVEELKNGEEAEPSETDSSIENVMDASESIPSNNIDEPSEQEAGGDVTETLNEIEMLSSEEE